MSVEDYFRTEIPKNPNHQSYFGNFNANPSPLRYPALENHAYIWIILVVVIPIVLAIILCLITICVYRYRKKKAQKISQIVTRNQIQSYQSQANIFIMEEQPPSYEILNEKNQNKNSFILNPYTNEQTSPSSSIHTVRTNVN